MANNVPSSCVVADCFVGEFAVACVVVVVRIFGIKKNRIKKTTHNKNFVFRLTEYGYLKLLLFKEIIKYLALTLMTNIGYDIFPILQ